MIVHKSDHANGPMSVQITRLTESYDNSHHRDFSIARKMIQKILLDFQLPGLPRIGNDGSSGRLIYEIAKCCPGSHRPGGSTSNAVMQQNDPLGSLRNCAMSLVELPSEWTEEKGKKSHGSYLKKSWMFDNIRHKAKCNMHLCGDEFDRPVRYGDPYVLITGFSTDWRGVDYAVEMVKDEIRKHQRNCRCSYI